MAILAYMAADLTKAYPIVLGGKINKKAATFSEPLMRSENKSFILNLKDNLKWGSINEPIKFSDGLVVPVVFGRL